MKALVGMASSSVSIGQAGPCKGLSWRGIICIGSSLGVPLGEGEDVMPSR